MKVNDAFLRLSKLLGWVGKAEKSTLFAVSASAVALYAFAKIAEEVLEGDTESFDTAVLLAFRNPADRSDPLGPPWLEGVMRDFTALGGIAVLALITAMVVGFLLLTRKRHAASMVAVSVAGGALMSIVLKWAFARPRPELVPHAMAVYSQSFPSAHAMLSAVVYLTLGTLLARTQSDVRVKLYLFGAAAALALLVGISRVYLGVHWPTDVLAGWAVGAGWSLLCWLSMLWLQGAGKVEPPAGHEAQAARGRT